jgi:hypothetical protein
MNEITSNKKELLILKKAVDNIEKITGKNLVQSDNIKKIINIVEKFISDKKLICYGGTAINNILPKDEQFYNLNYELPDYDFFSINAINNAKQLADIYYKAGYTQVEAKSGAHTGTYKVFVNFIPIADITQIDKDIFKSLKENAIKINDILYTPPDFLRMSMYLELSRPKGDISRWEKILKRLFLLNKYYPLNNPNCNSMNFMREFNGNKNDSKHIFSIVKETLIQQGVVFFGAYASSLYNKINNDKTNKNFNKKSPDFDVLSEDPENIAIILKDILKENNYQNVKIYKKPAIGEIISEHYELVYNDDSLVYIYKPSACHSYNIIKLNNINIKIASIDTIMSFYLAFIFSNRKYYDHTRIYCMAQFLFNVQKKQKLNQTGILKRFGFKCYGKQQTLEDLRYLKSQKYKELKENFNFADYEKYFLKYSPETEINKKNKKNTKNTKNTRKTRKVNNILEKNRTRSRIRN